MERTLLLQERSLFNQAAIFLFIEVAQPGWESRGADGKHSAFWRRKGVSSHLLHMMSAVPDAATSFLKVL